MTINVDVGQAVNTAARAGRFVLWIALAMVALVVGAVVLSIRMAVGPFSDAVRSVSTVTQQIGRATGAPSRQRMFTPAELNEPGDFGWRQLEVAAPPTGWKEFEPVGNLEWAQAIAREWQPDALLTRIDVNRVTPLGSVDLAAGPGNSAGYRFVSPGQIEEWRRVADRDSDARAAYELMLKITQEKVTALVNRGRPPSVDLPPEKIDTRPLPEVLTGALKSRDFAEYPFYNGYMIALEREGWVWYMQSLSRQQSLPRIRARDAAVWPYIN